MMISTYPTLDSLGLEWDALALNVGSPFLTRTWLSCWWSAFGCGDPLWLVLRDSDGFLRAGAFLHRIGRRIEASANVHSGDWDGLASNDEARAELWAAIACQGVNRIRLQAVPAESSRLACRELESAGYRVVCKAGPYCPRLELPDSWDELIGAVSGGLRQQIGRRYRALQRQGALTFRTVGGGPTLEDDLSAFFYVEASGWKGRAGTAIVSNAATERLYRGFARAAAANDWLRLHLLELDGVVIAASYDCVYEGNAFLLKTSFSEAHGRYSPGLVLLAEVLRSSIEEGLRCYEFLGEPERYKTRWTSALRPRVHIWAYRGLARQGYLYPQIVRPLLRTAYGRLSAVLPRYGQR